MRRTACAAVLSAAALLCACSKEDGFVYITYEVPEAGASLEAPAGWRRFGARWGGYGGAPGGPAFTRFIAESEPQHDGLILGAYISLTRVDKKRDTTESEEALFRGGIPGVAKTHYGKLDARTYKFEYRYRYDEEHKPSLDVPMRTEGVAIDAPDAYFVLEYRANEQVYPKYRPAFLHAVKTLDIRGR